jgi:endonuclease YncB( thermonuclease family)
MKVHRILSFALIVSLSCSVSPPEIVTGKVVFVKDGDTIIILVGKEQIRVRLFGVDCPEKGQPYGAAAKKKTADLCLGSIVEVHEHGRDQYNRVLAEVILEDGSSLNLALLKSGMAWHYKQYSDNEEWALVEEEAREQKKGLWSDNNAEAPWLFRKEKRIQMKKSGYENYFFFFLFCFNDWINRAQLKGFSKGLLIGTYLEVCV